jgi:hypothetical protein
MRQMRPAGSAVKGIGLTTCLLATMLATAGAAVAQDADPPKLPAPVLVADDDLSAALESGELSEAEYALERARSIFRLARVRAEFGNVAAPAPHEATLILRDLAARVEELSGAERKAAERLLARPPMDTGGVPIGNGWTVSEASNSPLCGGNVCVHWVTTSADAPASTDVNPANTIPDWVDLALSTWEFAWFQEIDLLGYRAPLSDLSSPEDNGGDAALDVYLDDLGPRGVFGYCTSDDPNTTAPSIFAVSAYCVVDNDYSAVQYGTEHTPQEFLEVTSAHEFHHASQFAYDWLEDYWMLEGTASNMEETVYPLIDDNVNFLRFWSPLNRPSSPLDRGGMGNSEYGSWIFWRFLEEKVAGDPTILREIWQRADAAFPGISADDYSLQAVRKELASRGLTFPEVFADFGVANRLRDYNDAAAAGYPTPPRTRTYTVGRQQRDTGWRSWRINHLATRYFAFRAGRAVSGSATLRVAVKLPRHGARATLVVFRSNGSVSTRRLRRNAAGDLHSIARFGRGEVERVELVLSNGSTRIPLSSCWNDRVQPFFSCFGRPLDDRRVFQLRATLR